MKLNLRGFLGSNPLSAEKAYELEKLTLEVEKIRANKKLDGTYLANYKSTRAWSISLCFLSTMWAITMFGIPEVNKFYALRHNYIIVGSNFISKDKEDKALDQQHQINLIRQNKIIIGNIVLPNPGNDTGKINFTKAVLQLKQDPKPTDIVQSVSVVPYKLPEFITKLP